MSTATPAMSWYNVARFKCIRKQSEFVSGPHDLDGVIWCSARLGLSAAPLVRGCSGIARGKEILHRTGYTSLTRAAAPTRPRSPSIARGNVLQDYLDQRISCRRPHSSQEPKHCQRKSSARLARPAIFVPLPHSSQDVPVFPKGKSLCPMTRSAMT